MVLEGLLGPNLVNFGPLTEPRRSSSPNCLWTSRPTRMAPEFARAGGPRANSLGGRMIGRNLRDINIPWQSFLNV